MGHLKYSAFSCRRLASSQVIPIVFMIPRLFLQVCSLTSLYSASPGFTSSRFFNSSFHRSSFYKFVIFTVVLAFSSPVNSSPVQSNLSSHRTMTSFPSQYLPIVFRKHKRRFAKVTLLLRFPVFTGRYFLKLLRTSSVWFQRNLYSTEISFSPGIWKICNQSRMQTKLLSVWN